MQKVSFQLLAMRSVMCQRVQHRSNLLYSTGSNSNAVAGAGPGLLSNFRRPVRPVMPGLGCFQISGGRSVPFMPGLGCFQISGGRSVPLCPAWAAAFEISGSVPLQYSYSTARRLLYCTVYGTVVGRPTHRPPVRSPEVSYVRTGPNLRTNKQIYSVSQSRFNIVGLGSRYSYQYGTSYHDIPRYIHTVFVHQSYQGQVVRYCRCGDAAAMRRSPQQSLYSRRQIGFIIRV